jgi:hypothetical protein
VSRRSLTTDHWSLITGPWPTSNPRAAPGPPVPIFAPSPLRCSIPHGLPRNQNTDYRLLIPDHRSPITDRWLGSIRHAEHHNAGRADIRRPGSLSGLVLRLRRSFAATIPAERISRLGIKRRSANAKGSRSPSTEIGTLSPLMKFRVLGEQACQLPLCRLQAPVKNPQPQPTPRPAECNFDCILWQ